ncbi:MAG TPA: diaminopimelate decarboxylase [Candidatus Binatia bacterium]|nr:diaminopimelate decarboxylase [Candidatus Binatia bacterium]
MTPAAAFEYRDGELCCEQVPLARLAERHGTPLYVYSRAALLAGWRAFDGAFAGTPHLLCFAVKANDHLAILHLFARAGAGFDVVSGGELWKALRAGADPGRIVFSGVGKTDDEIAYALEQRILMLNVESPEELDAVERVAARLGVRAPIALRVNPDVDPKTHPYIATGMKKSKFGIPIADALAEYRRAHALSHLEPIGVDCHIGSQLTDVAPFVDALGRVRHLIGQLAEAGLAGGLRYLDLGGGVGITYENETPPAPAAYAAALTAGLAGLPLTLVLEPGRALVGNAGVLLTRVVYRKATAAKRFVVVDGAMNDLLRPALYGSYHALRPVRPRGAPRIVADVVGPVCESGDFLARDRELETPEAGDLLAVMSAGAYGFVMASNYNARPRPAAVLVDGATYHIVRERETREDLIRGESIPPDRD